MRRPMSDAAVAHAIDRRSFLSLAAAGVLAAPPALSARTAPARSSAGPWRNALIVNALGSLDNVNLTLPSAAGDAQEQNGPESPREWLRRVIDPRAMREARGSGLTAINVTIGYVGGPMEPFEHTVREIAMWDGLVRERAGDLLKVRSAADIVRAKSENKIGVIYGFQNSNAIGDQVDRLDTFADLGVRIIQLTYNTANPVGEGSMAPENRGLTPFGREVLERLNANRVMVDLSHSGQNTCLEAARLSRQPISINHTGCRALADWPLNKTDEELRLVASRGGFIGIYFVSFFLTATGKAGVEDVVAHIEHAIEVCGEDHVGIGTDGHITAVDDMQQYNAWLSAQVEKRRAMGVGAAGEQPAGLPFVPDLQGPAQFLDLADSLHKRGHSTGRIEKILGGNFLRYAREVWGA